MHRSIADRYNAIAQTQAQVYINPTPERESKDEKSISSARADRLRTQRRRGPYREMLRRITRNGGVGVRRVRRWLILSCVSRDDLKRRSVSPRPLTLFRPRPRRGPRARAKKRRKRAVAFSTKNRRARIRRRGKERGGCNVRRGEQRRMGAPP